MRKLIASLCLTIAVLLGSAGVSWGAEFPTGTLKGISFSVEKGSMKFTEKGLYQWYSFAEVKKRPNGEISIRMDVTLQRSPATQVRNDKRFDTYKVIWESENKGHLINTKSYYKRDKSHFSIVGNRITIKSWIHRNQYWETQTYRFER